MRKTTVYPNLRAEMGRKHLSISALARELDMDRANLSKMLSSEYRLTLDTALSIKNKCFPEHSIEYLFGEKD